MSKSGLAKRYAKALLELAEQKGQAAECGRALTDFVSLLDEREGVRQIMVYTAVPLAEKEQEGLRAALAAKLGAEIRLKSTVDESLIGGVKVRIDDTVYDASLRCQLNALKHSLTVDQA